MSNFYQTPFNFRNRDLTLVGSITTASMDNNRSTYDETNTATLSGTIRSSSSSSYTIDSIYLIGSNIASYSLSGGPQNRAMPAATRGLQYDLFSFTETSQTAYTLSLTRSVAANPIRLYEVWLMKSELSFVFEDTFDDFNFERQERVTTIHQALDGEETKDRGFAPQRKLELTYTTEGLTPDQVEDLIEFGDNYENFVHSEYFELYPQRVYLAYFPDSLSTRFRIPLIGPESEEVSTFTVKER